MVKLAGKGHPKKVAVGTPRHSQREVEASIEDAGGQLRLLLKGFTKASLQDGSVVGRSVLFPGCGRGS